MNRKNASFVRQATFLMVAGLIVRIIGLLYRTPMKATIGGLGYGYYGYAYNVYNILLLISGYSIPVAVSKLMAERIAKKQYRNAQRVFWGAVLYILLIGSLAGLVASVFARQPLPAGADGALMALRTLAPVRADTTAVVMATPAEGPSLGTAPSGKWMWMSRLL